jgi:hypothetical protein
VRGEERMRGRVRRVCKAVRCEKVDGRGLGEEERAPPLASAIYAT